MKLRFFDCISKEVENGESEKQKIVDAKNPTELLTRFDVIEIYAPQGIETLKPEIHHLEDAFT